MEEQCLTVVDNARKGKNMFALGMLAWIYDRDMDLIREEIAFTFRKKSRGGLPKNVELLELGYAGRRRTWTSASTCRRRRRECRWW
jgi:2-oxoglutarate/2-oxoacid ferredoxin oxidoreductase subunit alpha